jgi:CRISPR/Cas system CSM-associated protein Csm5 (group 7 of RAMP superfamily)
LVQLGWGTGWGSKTFGSRLQQDPNFMERVIGDYRMARGNRRVGDAFPSSRRICVGLRKDTSGRIVQTALYPLGWAWLSFKRRSVE